MAQALNKFRFTKSALSKLEPREKTYYVYDTKVAGLSLRVNKDGSKTFVLYRRFHTPDAGVSRPERVN